MELIAYVDGGSHGSPGPAGIGVVLEGCGAKKLRICRWIGRQDNNVAEYMALLEALQQAIRLRARSLSVYTDSQVVVRQMTGEYTCRSRRLAALNFTCRKLAVFHCPHSAGSQPRGQFAGQPGRARGGAG